MRYKQIRPIVEQQLDEIAMSPTSLQKLAAQIDARAGMEFEMYVPGAQGDSDDYDQQPDMEYNERAYDISQVADFFEDGDFNGRRQVREFRSRMEEAYFEWRDNKIAERWDEDGFEFYVTWVANNVDEVDIKEWLGKADDEDYTPGKNDILDYANKLWGEDDSSKHDAYDEFREEQETDNDLSDQYWMDDEGINDMEDAMRSFGNGEITWPYWTDHQSGGHISIDDIASEFAQAVGKPTKPGGSYHSIRSSGRPDATNQFYIVETDGSLDSPDSDEDSGLEFVSPAMPVEELFQDLGRIREWANRMGCYTNESTGLHMNVSVPGWTKSDAGKGGTLDYVKLVLLMGDQYVLDQFDRASNTFCSSGLEKVQERIRTNTGLAEPLLNQMKGHLNDLASKVLGVLSTTKYTSANIKDGYVEFRSPGGDWLRDLTKDEAKIKNTMLRFVVALDAATDPNKYRQEYLKKLYKMLAPSGEQSTIEYFARYVAGELPKAALRSFVKQAQLQRKMRREGEQFWWRVDFGNKSTEVIAGTESEALKLAAKEWGVSPESVKTAEITNIGSHAQNPKDIQTQPARTGVNTNNAPVRATTSPGQLPPSNPQGNWAVLNPGRSVVYRFDAPSLDSAERIKWSWCNANGVTDPDIYRVSQIRGGYEVPPQQTFSFGQQYNIIRGMNSAAVAATFVADTDQEAIARLAQYRQDHPGTEYNVKRATNTDTQQPAAGGNFTGWWKIINADGVELHRFNGIGNVQSDANNVARSWIRQNPQYANTGLNVVPVMG